MQHSFIPSLFEGSSYVLQCLIHVFCYTSRQHIAYKKLYPSCLYPCGWSEHGDSLRGRWTTEQDARAHSGTRRAMFANEQYPEFRSPDIVLIRIIQCHLASYLQYKLENEVALFTISLCCSTSQVLTKHLEKFFWHCHGTTPIVSARVRAKAR